MEETYYLKTSWGTYIHESVLDGTFFHAPARQNSNYVSVRLNTEAINKFATLERLKLPGWPEKESSEIILQNNETVGIKRGSTYLSAELDGSFTLQKWLKGWELFKLVRPSDIPVEQTDTKPYIQRTRRTFSIPKLIHQTIGATDTLPTIIKGNIENLKTANFDWKHILWSDKDIMDFIYESYGYDVLARYLRINPRYGAARADLFRYLCIYKMGGAYLDIKSGCKQPLSSIVQADDQFLLSQWDDSTESEHRGFGSHRELSHIPGGEYQQWHVIGTPGHPYLAGVIDDVLARIDRYDERFDGVGRVVTLRTTGPIAYTLSIHSRLKSGQHRFIDAKKEGLVYKVVKDTWRVFTQHYSKQTSPLVL